MANCANTSHRMGKAGWIGTGAFAVLLALLLAVRTDSGPTVPDGPTWATPTVERDLMAIRHDTLRILVLRDPLSWEPRPGAEVGLEWELLRRFARATSVPIKALQVHHPDSMLALLQRGEGDILACQLNPNGFAKDLVAFTSPYRRVAPVRIHLRPDPAVPAGKKAAKGTDTLLVSRWSPFLGPDTSFIEMEGIVLMKDTTAPEELLAQVAIGNRKEAVVSDATAAMEFKRLPQVEFGERLGRSVPLAFGVRTNAPELLAALDAWLTAPDEQEARDLITKAQNNVAPRGSMRSKFGTALRGDTISPYDSLFQVHADDFHWDWKLLAAVAYTESRFNPDATYKGAHGLMQLMPTTAERMGHDSAGGVDSHIRTATRYLAKLDTMWRRQVPNSDQRMRFVLASYNAGPGHILDAQRLARKLGLDPLRWEGHVERALTLLNRPRYFLRPEVRTGFCHGDLTFWYVRDIAAAFHGARVTSQDQAALR